MTGVLTDDSIAYGVAELAQREGADLVLTSFGRAMSLTRRVAKHLPSPPDVLELDVTDQAHVEAVAAELQQRWGALDGLLHSIGYAPPSCLGGGFLEAPWEDVRVALEVSAYSLKSLAAGFLPLFKEAGGGAVVGLDFDATVAWPGYDWMGVAKSTLESTARYLARDLAGTGYASTSWPPDRCAPWPPVRSRGSNALRAPGWNEPRSAGIRPTRVPSQRPAWPSCPTSSRPRPARWST